MRLVIGLGNPGGEYDKTRHNVGFMFLDYVTNNAKFNLNKKFNALEYETIINGEKILFIKPLSFMNLSGEVITKYVNFYKISKNDILVIQDDLDLDVGKYKLLYNRGDGGHKGIKSIINNLQSRAFLRLKIGISKGNSDIKDYVLGKFNDDELIVINDTFSKLNNFLNDYIAMNKDLLMGKYNSKDNN